MLKAFETAQPPGHSLVTVAVVSGVFVLLEVSYELVFSLGRRTERRGIAALKGAIAIRPPRAR